MDDNDDDDDDENRKNDKTCVAVSGLRSHLPKRQRKGTS